MKSKKLPPIHPGKILLEEFLEPMEISQYKLAKDISVPARRINEIVLQKRSITADTALRLGIFFNMSPHFWMNLQSRFEIEKAEDHLEKKLKIEVHQYKTTSTLELNREGMQE
jgi:addiction module HigA family antidote